MICRFAAAGAAALLMLVASAAQAKPLPEGGMTGAEMKAWLVGTGETVELTKGDDGDPILKTDIDGMKVSIYLYDCTKERCTSIQMSVGLDLDEPLSAEKTNTWNQTKRYVHVYTDDEGDPYFSYDVNLAPGGTYEALEDNWAVYLSMLPDIREFVGWD